MVISNDQILSDSRIIAEIAAVVDWHVRLLRQCFYPEAGKGAESTGLPADLLPLCRKLAEKDLLDKKIIAQLMMAHQKLQDSATFFADSLPPLLEQYDSMSAAMEAYIAQLHRLQQKIPDVGTEVDPVTGLRMPAGIYATLKAEQERFERKGTLFSVAAIAIDHVRELEAKYDSNTQGFIYAHLAQSLLKSLRAFDDAYYFGQGEYVIILKELDFLDACAAIDRLQRDVETFPALLPNGEKARITASFGVAEAIRDESSEMVLEHARESLLIAQREGGNRIQEYREQSKLARLASDLRQEK